MTGPFSVLLVCEGNLVAHSKASTAGRHVARTRSRSLIDVDRAVTRNPGTTVITVAADTASSIAWTPSEAVTTKARIVSGRLTPSSHRSCRRAAPRARARKTVTAITTEAIAAGSIARKRPTVPSQSAPKTSRMTGSASTPRTANTGQSAAQDSVIAVTNAERSRAGSFLSSARTGTATRRRGPLICSNGRSTSWLAWTYRPQTAVPNTLATNTRSRLRTSHSSACTPEASSTNFSCARSSDTGRAREGRQGQDRATPNRSASA